MKKITPLLFCLFFITIGFSQVGVGTTSPKTTLDVKGSLALREGPALVLGSGDNANIDLGSEPYSLYRITGPTSSFIVSGIRADNEDDGHLLTLINTTPSPMILQHNGNSFPNFRIFCPGNQDLRLAGQYSSATLQYNKELKKWMVISTSQNDKSSSISSVSFVGQVEIDYESFENYKDVPGMKVRFTAEKTTAMVFLTTAGQARRSNAGASDISLRVIDQNNNVLGGTALNIRAGTNLETLSFSKLMTDLIPGNVYELTVQGRTLGGNRFLQQNPRYVIKPGERETDHMALTVMQ